MASDMLGRGACPECGFAHAHIKIKTDKDNAHPYRHCPECGAQYFPRNQTQADNLRKTIRAGSEPNATREERVETPEQSTRAAKNPLPEPAYKIVLGVRVPA